MEFDLPTGWGVRATEPPGNQHRRPGHIGIQALQEEFVVGEFRIHHRDKVSDCVAAVNGVAERRFVVHQILGAQRGDSVAVMVVPGLRPALKNILDGCGLGNCGIRYRRHDF